MSFPANIEMFHYLFKLDFGWNQGEIENDKKLFNLGRGSIFICIP